MRVLQEEIPAGLFFLRAGDGRNGSNATNVGNGTDVNYGRTWDRFGEVVP